MDRIHLEPSNRLYQDQSGLQELLRRAHVKTAEGHGTEQLSEWVQIDATAAHAGTSATLEKATDYIRELDERPVS